MAHELGDRFRDARQLSRPQLGKHGQGQNFLRGVLGVREIAGLMSERSVERLKVQRHRVIHGAADFFLGQDSLQFVALFNANGVLVKNVLVAFRN
jgi:hypothetical protein